MLLSQLEYFVALAGEQHFGRAAALSYVSPSTLSESIRKLETELGVQLVRRGRTFEGLTGDGEQVLIWAQKIVADHRALLDALAASHGELCGHARFGTIPSGTSVAARVISQVSHRHPQLAIGLRSGLTSEEIVEGIRAHELDAGLIHPSSVDGPDLYAVPIERIRAVIVAPADFFPADTAAVSGRMLQGVPVALLEPHMRARQIFDSAMAAVGVDIAPRIESDSVDGLLQLAEVGRIAAVVPAPMADRQRIPDHLRVLELLEPSVHTPVAYVRLIEEPLPALSAAFDAVATASLERKPR